MEVKHSGAHFLCGGDKACAIFFPFFHIKTWKKNMFNDKQVASAHAFKKLLQKNMFASIF